MSLNSQQAGRDAHGRRVIHEGLQAHTVFGGYKIATAEWTRTDDGWDCDYQILSSTLYPSKAACDAAIADLRAAAAAPVRREAA